MPSSPSYVLQFWIRVCLFLPSTPFVDCYFFFTTYEMPRGPGVRFNNSVLTTWQLDEWPKSTKPGIWSIVSYLFKISISRVTDSYTYRESSRGWDFLVGYHVQWLLPYYKSDRERIKENIPSWMKQMFRFNMFVFLTKGTKAERSWRIKQCWKTWFKKSF